MTQTRRTQTVSILLWVLVCSAIVGALIGVSRAPDGDVTESLLWGALTGVLIGVGGTAFEIAVFANTSLRLTKKLPVAWNMVLRAVAYGGVIFLGLSVPILLDGGSAPWRDPEFTEVFVVSGFVALGFSVGIEILRQLGSEATLALFTGRYMRPRIEDRVILFADLVGSTALAERIGELQFHAFLQEVALDVADPIDMSKGRVHRYVGDAVIVTWPKHVGLNKAACLSCALGMVNVLRDRAAIYQAEFGSQPKLRIAIHCGQVAAGEIGAWKKEITYLGDAMNTASRIEAAARALGAEIAVSDAVAQELPADARTTLTRLPEYAAQGKRAPLLLWTLKDVGGEKTL